MGNDTPQPMDTFESWLLRCVAQAVEAGDVAETHADGVTGQPRCG
jgi:hypothetical protein